MDKDAPLNGKGRSLSTRVGILEEKQRLTSIVLKWLLGTVTLEIVVAIIGGLFYLVARNVT